MAIQNIFRISKQTRILLIILVCISATGFFIAWLYYNDKNESEDPRVTKARIKLVEYDRLMKERKYSEALLTLDTIIHIYENAPGYVCSFESGMLYNNRGSVYLSMALYDSFVPAEEKMALLRLAEENIQKGIQIYTNWIDSAGKLDRDQITRNIAPFFPENDPGLPGKNHAKIIKKRVEDVVFAQTETPRRLSVSLTNLGTVQRHQFRQEEATQSYLKAMKLWEENFTARNNFNILMGLPPEDRSIIDKLFPPERIKSN